MKSPYCGWNKNDKDNSPEAGNYDFMKYDKDNNKSDTEELNSYENSIRNNAKQN